MLIPTTWLSDFVSVEDDPQSLADRLTTTGNEIEEIRSSDIGPVFYLKLTPNRADMLCLEGAAREAASLYEADFRPAVVDCTAHGPAEPSIRVDVQAPDLCPRYVARVIRDVKIGPSPDWLKQRLEAVGVRSISNVVDATNYVMFELGQPLHAFDLDLLEESRIVVRRASEGETIIAIDGTKAALTPDMLVIADGAKPVAIAGVMGGQFSEVSDGTTSILLESAYFDPTSVRRTSKRTGVSSPSSYRFERGVDPNGVRRAADRAAALIAELAGGTVSETVIDVYPAPIAPKRVRLRPERCRGLLGIDVSDAEAERYLSSLGLTVERATPDEWRVTVPTYRPDIAIEEDVIEEVGRMYGYDRLPETLPSGESGAGALSAQERLVRTAREHLLAQGLFEAVTSTLVSRPRLAAAGLERSPVWPAADQDASPLPLRNPLSDEFDTLRPSLLPGLLAATGHNLRHGSPNVFLFESGYAHSNLDAPEDRLLIAGVLYGTRWSDTWNADSALATDFFSAKGVVEGLVSAVNVPEPNFGRAEHLTFHPGRSAWVTLGEQVIGIVGELHPDKASALDLPRGVYAFELDAAALLEHSGERRRYEATSRYPRALRDLAVVVGTEVESGAIERILREEMGEFGRSVRLFDVYAGKPLPEGRVSLAYAMELGASDRTLTDDEVDSRIEAAKARLTAAVGAEFRG